MKYTVEPARPSERKAAFRLLFQQAPEADRETRVQRALELVDRGEFPEDGLLICRAGSMLVGAMAAIPLPGAAGLCWPPQVTGAASVVVAAIEDMLIKAALGEFRRRGAGFVQALPTTDEIPQAPALLRHGFSHITTLLYLELNAPTSFPVAPPARLRFESYAACDRSVFHATLWATYENTLDCPELNGLRTLDQIVEGHRAAFGCRLDWWWLAFVADRPVGVVVTAKAEEPDAWELSYLGLVPAARGRGLGTALATKAITACQSEGIKRVTLAVDRRNSPALRLYARLGFVETDRREVLLMPLGDRHSLARS
jgi:ribosomal protein S18 acetylase RimI-like enzyme